MSELDWNTLQADAKDVLLPDGDYVCIVSKAESVRASTGKPMIKLQLTVADGPKRDRKLFTQQVVSADSPFALQRWFAAMAAFGLDSAYFNANPTMEKIATDLLNRGVIAIVGHREWEGSDRNEVAGYRPFVPNGPVPPGMVLGAVGHGPAAPAQSGPTIGAMPGTPTPTASTPPSQPSAAPPKRPF